MANNINYNHYYSGKGQLDTFLQRMDRADKGFKGVGCAFAWSKYFPIERVAKGNLAKGNHQIREIRALHVWPELASQVKSLYKNVREAHQTRSVRPILFGSRRIVKSTSAAAQWLDRHRIIALGATQKSVIDAIGKVNTTTGLITNSYYLFDAARKWRALGYSSDAMRLLRVAAATGFAVLAVLSNLSLFFKISFSPVIWLAISTLLLILSLTTDFIRKDRENGSRATLGY